MKHVSCIVALCAVSLGTLVGGCARHSYATPVVVMVPTGSGSGADVAWIVEDEGRIVRCTNGPERPQCVRAEVR